MTESNHYDFIIVGSGASGGVFARNLAGSGARTLLLEAGREFNRHTFPTKEMDYSAQMFWGGGLEISQDGHLGFLRGKCVGGTTVLNQALLDRFDEYCFKDWRERSGCDSFHTQHLSRHYDEVEKRLSIQSIPEEHYNQNAKYFSSGFDKLGYYWSPLKRGQGDCKLDRGSDCMACLGGCRRNSKQSTLVTEIAEARKSGLEVQSDFEVSHIEEQGGSIVVYGVQSLEKKEEFRCNKLVLASGSFGNYKILKRSPFSKSIPALGKHFTCHPQYMTFAYFEKPVDAHKGALQAVKSDDVRLRRSGYKFENIFAPPIATAMLMPGLGRSHQKMMKRYRHLSSIEVCIRDEPVGEIQMDQNGRLIIDKPVTSSDRKKINEGLQLVREIYESLNAKKIIQCRQGFGLHLMGGCSVGVAEDGSVVNPDFQLWENKNISIADSSVFPAAPGINPSLTIMALSELVSRKLVK